MCTHSVPVQCCSTISTKQPGVFCCGTLHLFHLTKIVLYSFSLKKGKKKRKTKARSQTYLLAASLEECSLFVRFRWCGESTAGFRQKESIWLSTWHTSVSPECWEVFTWRSSIPSSVTDKVRSATSTMQEGPLGWEGVNSHLFPQTGITQLVFKPQALRTFFSWALPAAMLEAQASSGSILLQVS